MTTHFRKILLEIDPDGEVLANNLELMCHLCLMEVLHKYFPEKNPNKICMNVSPGSVTSDISSEMDLFSDSDGEEDFYVMDNENTTQSELNV